MVVHPTGRTPFCVPWYCTAYRPIHIGSQVSEFHPKKQSLADSEFDTVYRSIGQDCEVGRSDLSSSMHANGRPSNATDKQRASLRSYPTEYRCKREKSHNSRRCAPVDSTNVMLTNTLEFTKNTPMQSNSTANLNLSNNTASTTESLANKNLLTNYHNTRSMKDLDYYGRQKRNHYGNDTQPAGVVTQYFRRFHPMNTSIPYH